MYKLFEIVAYCSFNTVCSKVCIQNDPVDIICAAHKRKREAEMKLRDQIVTLGLFFFFGLLSLQCNKALVHRAPFDATI